MTTAPQKTSPPENRLAGGLGAGAIVFMVVAAAAPLAVVGGVLPVGAITGNGVGMPTAFLIDGIILMFFAVGLATMSRHVTRPGAFFTYVGYGLGRPLGVAAAWLALLTYAAALLAVFAFLGLSFGGWVDEHFGADLPWWCWTLALIAGVGMLGYRHVALSSKVLGVVLMVEVGAVLMLSIVILLQGGADGLSTASFHPSEFMSGNPALALMWGMAGYSGFESTVIYRDEARDAERTIPRATYGALILIALFYTFASWALVQAWGHSFDEEVAGATSNFVVATADRYLGAAGSEVINVLLLTSFFACLLSFHNVIARYQHAMANAGLMPRRIGRVHVRHQSPHISSVALTLACLLMVSVFALIQLDPYLEVYTWFGGVASVALVLLMGLTSVAVIVYLNRERVPEGPWKTWVAPVIGLLGLMFVAFMMLKNLPMLLGDVDAEGQQRVGGLSISIYALMAAFPIFGLAQAFWLRRFRPTDYHDVIDSASK